jgi:hypothetical protein
MRQPRPPILGFQGSSNVKHQATPCTRRLHAYIPACPWMDGPRDSFVRRPGVAAATHRPVQACGANKGDRVGCRTAEVGAAESNSKTTSLSYLLRFLLPMQCTQEETKNRRKVGAKRRRRRRRRRSLASSDACIVGTPEILDSSKENASHLDTLARGEDRLRLHHP